MATIKSLKSLVAPDVLPCPDPIVNREVVSILLEFCDKTNILTRELSLPIDQTEIDSDRQNSISFDVAEYVEKLRPIKVLELMIDTNSYVPKKRYIKYTLSNWIYVKEDGVKYYHILDDHLIQVYDLLPTDGEIYMRIACKPTRDADEIDDFILEDWSDAIVAGAKWKLLSMPGKDWSDPGAGEFYRREWRRYMSQAKAEMTKNLPGNIHRVNWVDFETGF